MHFKTLSFSQANSHSDKSMLHFNEKIYKTCGGLDVTIVYGLSNLV
jgi:hypothetical protein